MFNFSAVTTISAGAENVLILFALFTVLDKCGDNVAGAAHDVETRQSISQNTMEMSIPYANPFAGRKLFISCLSRTNQALEIDQ